MGRCFQRPWKTKEEMIRFNGTVSEFRKFLDANFTKRAIKDIKLSVEFAIGDPTQPALAPVPFQPEFLAKLERGTFMSCQGAVQAPHVRNKIQAIKEVRAISGMGLNEAKDWVEYFYPNRFAAFSQ